MDSRTGAEGEIKQIKPEEKNGALTVSFGEYVPWMPYNVIDTDYISYALVYSCEEVFWGLMTAEYLWVLQRDAQSELNESIVKKADSVFKK